jgi:hypothetical protein
LMSTEVKQNSFKEKVMGVIDQILPPSEVKLEEIREEVWRDLSALYYKYEDEDQKKAFREVMHDICERIKDGRWESVYNKLYRAEQKEKSF